MDWMVAMSVHRPSTHKATVDLGTDLTRLCRPDQPDLESLSKARLHEFDPAL